MGLLYFMNTIESTSIIIRFIGKTKNCNYPTYTPTSHFSLTNFRAISPIMFRFFVGTRYGINICQSARFFDTQRDFSIMRNY